MARISKIKRIKSANAAPRRRRNPGWKRPPKAALAEAAISMVYVTTPDLELARKIAEEAVQSGLATCANFWSQMNSIYSWEGSLRHDQECVLIFKAKSENLKELEALVCSHHSYQVPCFLHWPLAGGAESYINWLLA